MLTLGQSSAKCFTCVLSLVLTAALRWALSLIRGGNWGSGKWFVQRHPTSQRQGSVPNGASLFLSAKPWCPCDHMFPKTWLKCRIIVEQVWAPLGHSVLSMFRSKDFLTWTGVELQWGRARPGFSKQCHAEWGSRRLRGPLSGALFAFYGWLSFMTPKNPFFVLFIADLKHQALLFL